MISAGQVLRIDGDMAALAAHADSIAAAGRGVADTGAGVHRIWQELAPVYIAPETGQLLAATGPVATVSGSVGEDCVAAADALRTYAAEVAEIQAALDALRQHAADLQDDAAAHSEQDLFDREVTLHSAHQALVGAWEQAQHRCASALRGLTGDTPAPGSGVAGAFATGSAAAAGSFATGGVTTAPPSGGDLLGVAGAVGSLGLRLAGSFGEALVEHPLEAAGVVLGAGLVAVSLGGEVAGVALDATGVGAVAGIPLGGLSTAGLLAGFGLVAAGGTVIAQAAVDDFTADSAGSAAGSPPEDPPYVNNNPRATPTETAAGELLNREARAGRLPGITGIEGAAEVPGKRSGDYRAIAPDGSETPVDHYEPRTSRTSNIETHVEEKSGQAETVVVEFGQGGTAEMGVKEAEQISDNVLSTPGHGVRRLIFIKDGRVILDRS